MKQFIGCDMHKRFSVFATIDENGKIGKPVKVVNDSLELRPYLATLLPGTPVAVEARGGWYWFVDELEAAGLDVRLVNPLEAKKRMRGRNKTDELDAAGLACCSATEPCRRSGFRRVRYATYAAECAAG